MLTSLLPMACSQAPYRQTFPSGHQLILPGVRAGYKNSVPMDDVMTASVTFKVSGEPTLTGVAAARNIALPAISGVAKASAPLQLDSGIWKLTIRC